MKMPAICVPVASLTLAAAVLSVSPVIGAESGRAQIPPPLAVFDVPLGATLEQVRALGPARNHPASGYSQRIVSIDNLPGTDHVSLAFSRAEFEGRVETFAFHFTGPPSEGRAWSGGTIQEFGRPRSPSPQAPFGRDVLPAMTERYGQTSFSRGGEHWWFWDINGRPMRVAVNSPCTRAIQQVPSHIPQLSSNSAVGNPVGLQLARRTGCAYGVYVRYAEERGQVYRLETRMVDFKAGLNAWVLTSRHIATLGTAADQERSRRNRPVF